MNGAGAAADTDTGSVGQAGDAWLDDDSATRGQFARAARAASLSAGEDRSPWSAHPRARVRIRSHATVTPPTSTLLGEAGTAAVELTDAIDRATRGRAGSLHRMTGAGGASAGVLAPLHRTTAYVAPRRVPASTEVAAARLGMKVRLSLEEALTQPAVGFGQVARHRSAGRADLALRGAIAWRPDGDGSARLPLPTGRADCYGSKPCGWGLITRDCGGSGFLGHAVCARRFLCSLAVATAVDRRLGSSGLGSRLSAALRPCSHAALLVLRCV